MIARPGRGATWEDWADYAAALERQSEPISAFCGDCGGWESVDLREIGPGSKQFVCGTCEGALLNVRYPTGGSDADS